jgi:hypothetical protein
MFTYVGINLNTKKFQVGSTTDFPRRYKQHLKNDMNPEFNRALQKDPERFYWLISEDDGNLDRSEEQYYLDFYTGSFWCTNINPNAIEPPHHGGSKWWTKGDDVKRSINCPGEGWEEGTSGSMTSAIVKLNQERMDIVGEDGKSVMAVLMAHKSHSVKTEDGKSVRAVKLAQDWAYKLKEIYEDPDHPELGQTTAGPLVRKQKSRGYPHGKENRVKVQKEDQTV